MWGGAASLQTTLSAVRPQHRRRRVWPASGVWSLPNLLAVDKGILGPSLVPCDDLTMYRWNRYDKTSVNPLCAKTQMSISKISTDNKSSYPSMYQVMYVEKLFLLYFL